MGHYITEEVATAARVAAVDASLSLPKHSASTLGPSSPTGGTTSSSLFALSPHPAPTSAVRSGSRRFVSRRQRSSDSPKGSLAPIA